MLGTSVGAGGGAGPGPQEAGGLALRCFGNGQRAGVAEAGLLSCLGRPQLSKRRSLGQGGRGYEPGVSLASEMWDSGVCEVAKRSGSQILWAAVEKRGLGGRWRLWRCSDTRERVWGLESGGH